MAKPSPLKFVGARIRDCRSKLGISQEELAARADVHRTYIGGIERGERNVSLLNLVRIARALSVPVSELVSGVER
ncbi:MAG: helix-turn-helix transcriptional regulator [Bryobacteraceae bacterium]|jgi:transcriptional regulator with XRE-family HTH domain